MFAWISAIYTTATEVTTMSAKIDTLAADLAGIHSLLMEASAELGAKISALEAALGASGDLPEEAQVALADVRAAAQVLADMVPNAPAEPAPEPASIPVE